MGGMSPSHRRMVKSAIPPGRRERGGTYQTLPDPLSSITCERMGILPSLFLYVEPLNEAIRQLAAILKILRPGNATTPIPVRE